MSSIFTLSIVQSALELGFIYSLVALALFISFTILNIADLSTDGCFTLGCAVGAMVTLAGHPTVKRCWICTSWYFSINTCSCWFNDVST